MIDDQTSSRGFFAALWHGRLGLFHTFWYHFLSVNVLALLVLELIEGVSPWATAAVLVVVLAYLTVAAVGVWRAAGRYRGTVIWSVAARAAVCLFAVQLLLIAGALAGLARELLL